jgi:hypothetical protein
MQELLAISHLLVGNVTAARADVEAALIHQPGLEPHVRSRFSVDYPGRGDITLARILWLQGYPDQAVDIADRTIASAIALGHPVRLTRALLWAFAVYAWNGQADTYEDHAERIILEASKHDLGPFQAIGEAIMGVVRAAQGRIEEAAALLRNAVDKMEGHRYGPVTDFGIHLAEMLAQTDQNGEALAVIDNTIMRARRFHYLLEVPDMLRVKAELLISAHPPDVAHAERLLKQSLDLARQQAAPGWALRTATSLTKLFIRQQRYGEARDVLAPIYAGFTEGFDSPPLVAARALLEELDRQRSGAD